MRPPREIEDFSNPPLGGEPGALGGLVEALKGERFVLDNYDANERKSRNRVLIAFRHLRPSFKRTPAVFIAAATSWPHFGGRSVWQSSLEGFQASLPSQRSPVRNARKGFFEQSAFVQVIANLPEGVRPLVQFL